MIFDPAMSESFVPRRIFLAAGVGRHEHALLSFELALRDAGIAGCNLVPVTSIIPPGAVLLPFEEGVKSILPGAITYAVMGSLKTNTAGQLLGAAVAAAFPVDPRHHGYVAEVSGTLDEAGATGLAEELAREMLTTSRQLPAPKGARVVSIGCSATAETGWTTALAAAVLLP